MGCGASQSIKSEKPQQKSQQQKQHSRALDLQNEIEPYRQALTEHPLYKNIKDESDLRIFMQAHIYAVWDFMSILKSLQLNLTSVSVPWAPTKNPKTRRLINEIVLEEETDVDMEGNPASHVELYLQAMGKADAKSEEFENFLSEIQDGQKVKDGYKHIKYNEYVTKFLDFTFQSIENQPLHVIAAIFTYGRENLIPEMFSALIRDYNSKLQNKINLSGYIYYIDRHIELDGDHHGPMSLDMVAELCGDDDEKWSQCKEFSLKALESRKVLWDDILKQIEDSRKQKPSVL